MSTKRQTDTANDHPSYTLSGAIIKLQEASNHESVKSYTAEFPSQLTDGAVINFTADGNQCGSGRVRFSNRTVLDEQSGKLYCELYVTDLTLQGASVLFTRK